MTRLNIVNKLDNIFWLHLGISATLGFKSKQCNAIYITRNKDDILTKLICEQLYSKILIQFYRQSSNLKASTTFPTLIVIYRRPIWKVLEVVARNMKESKTLEGHQKVMSYWITNIWSYIKWKIFLTILINQVTVKREWQSTISQLEDWIITTVNLS